MAKKYLIVSHYNNITIKIISQRPGINLEKNIEKWRILVYNSVEVRYERS